MFLINRYTFVGIIVAKAIISHSSPIYAQSTEVVQDSVENVQNDSDSSLTPDGNESMSTITTAVDKSPDETSTKNVSSNDENPVASQSRAKPTSSTTSKTSLASKLVASVSEKSKCPCDRSLSSARLILSVDRLVSLISWNRANDLSGFDFFDSGGPVITTNDSFDNGTPVTRNYILPSAMNNFGIDLLIDSIPSGQFITIGLNGIYRNIGGNTNGWGLNIGTRIGYIITWDSFSILALWPRSSIRFTSWKFDDNEGGLKERNLFLAIEPAVILTLIPQIAFIVGPFLDIPLSTKIEPNKPIYTENRGRVVWRELEAPIGLGFSIGIAIYL